MRKIPHWEGTRDLGLGRFTCQQYPLLVNPKCDEARLSEPGLFQVPSFRSLIYPYQASLSSATDTPRKILLIGSWSVSSRLCHPGEA